MSDKQTVFISWSKPLSMQVALALREWLPNIFDQAEGWVSDVDIAAGARTYNTIAGALSKSVFGIIVVTALNQNEPWLNYEAGALSNKFHEDQNCVAPLVVDLRKADITSPIKQYQANDLDQQGMLKVCTTMAPIMGAGASTVEKRVAKFWPELQEAVEVAKANDLKSKHPSVTQKRDTNDIVAEVLTTVRDISRRLDQPRRRPVTWGELAGVHTEPRAARLIRQHLIDNGIPISGIEFVFKPESEDLTLLLRSEVSPTDENRISEIADRVATTMPGEILVVREPEIIEDGPNGSDDPK